MNTIPYLKTENGRTNLYVDDKKFFVRGGELHNSSGSDLTYLEQNVWPGLRKLGGNCYLTPVYWECLEPEPGCFDYTLMDGVIEQARREKVRLILLWFGLWKNGGSSYTPEWIKRDPECFYMQGQDGHLLESVSPFCEKAVRADQNAFEHVMQHLAQKDEERTVIMLQVENEVGVWGHPRDYSSAANQAFGGEIPDELAALYHTEGTWESAFGIKACEYFMAWYFGKAVGRIAAAGKSRYALPMFMNCVPGSIGISDLAGSCPSGGPVASVMEIWRAAAPAIDLYGPDVYAPCYRELTEAFARKNALVVPETGQGIDCIPKALYTFAAYQTILFSPFGIDGMMQPLGENDLLAQMNLPAMPIPARAGQLLAEAYRLLALMENEIEDAREDHRIWGFLEQGTPGEEFILDDYRIYVTYGGMEYSDKMLPPMPNQMHAAKCPDKPAGGGFILRMDRDRFLICGVSANLAFCPEYASQGQIFVLRKQEYRLTEDGLVKGRILNGDERNHLVLGSGLTIQEISFYRKG